MLEREGLFAIVGFGFVAPTINEPEHIEAGLVAELLGGSLSARLNQTLRGVHALAYHVDVGYDDANQGAALIGFVAVDEARVVETLTAIEDELAAPAPRDVARVKRAWLARTAQLPRRADLSPPRSRAVSRVATLASSRAHPRWRA